MKRSGSRVLVTGAGGQVGSALRGILEDATFATHADLDVTRPAEVDAAIGAYDQVIHLAGATNVDLCEAHPRMAWRVNSEGTRHICRAASASGARVLFVSTDYVFDGTKRGQYSESDRAAPINHYGRSKLAGEDHVLRLEDGLVVRTSWVMGSADSFLGRIRDAARRLPSVSVVSDQYGRPTFARDLAQALAWLTDQEMVGIVNVAGDGPPSNWADVAERIVAGVAGAVEVRRIGAAEYAGHTTGLVAPRPRNSTLSLDKARALGVPLMDWRESLAHHLRESA